VHDSRRRRHRAGSDHPCDKGTIRVARPGWPDGERGRHTAPFQPLDGRGGGPDLSPVREEPHSPGEMRSYRAIPRTAQSAPLISLRRFPLEQLCRPDQHRMHVGLHRDVAAPSACAAKCGVRAEAAASVLRVAARACGYGTLVLRAHGWRLLPRPQAWAVARSRPLGRGREDRHHD
jgi:hypothetical protein